MLTLTNIMIAVLVLVGLIVLGHALFAVARKKRAEQSGETVHPPRARLGVIRGVIYVMWLIALAAAAWTAYGPLMSGDGEHAHGWMLWWHMQAAGAFTGLLLLVTVAFAGRGGGGLARFSFWLMIWAGLVSLGTMLLSMLPVAGTREIELLIAIHTYSGLAVVAGALLHVYTFVAARIGLQ